MTVARKLLPFKGTEPQPAPEWEQALFAARSWGEIEAAIRLKDQMVRRAAAARRAARTRARRRAREGG